MHSESRRMALMVVGAGVGRTGTESLKLALEQLFGAPCYHMLEVLQQPESSRYWAAAGRGEMPDWDEVFEGYAACVDWPAAAFWREISAAYPMPSWCSRRGRAPRSGTAAPVRRSSPSTARACRAPVETNDFIPGMFDRFTPDIQDPEAAMAAYEAHNQRVRETVSPSRLVDWQPGDGWDTDLRGPWTPGARRALPACQYSRDVPAAAAGSERRAVARRPLIRAAPSDSTPGLAGAVSRG